MWGSGGGTRSIPRAVNPTGFSNLPSQGPKLSTLPTVDSSGWPYTPSPCYGSFWRFWPWLDLRLFGCPWLVCGSSLFFSSLNVFIISSRLVWFPGAGCAFEVSFLPHDQYPVMPKEIQKGGGSCRSRRRSPM